MLTKISAISFFVIAMLLGTGKAFSKPEYVAKEKAARPEVTCMTCHSSIPKKEDKDKQDTLRKSG